jgi:hypothetical protein
MVRDRHRAAALWPGVVSALLLCVTVALTACSGLAAPSEEAPPPMVDPNYRQLAAERLRSAFRDYAAYDNFQIAEPRWVHTPQGWTWLICVRFLDHGHARNYALFMQSNKIIDNRYAVEIDGCDAQPYAPFELMANGLQPIH